MCTPEPTGSQHCETFTSRYSSSLRHFEAGFSDGDDVWQLQDFLELREKAPNLKTLTAPSILPKAGEGQGEGTI